MRRPSRSRWRKSSQAASVSSGHYAALPAPGVLMRPPTFLKKGMPRRGPVLLLERSPAGSCYPGRLALLVGLRRTDREGPVLGIPAAGHFHSLHGGREAGQLPPASERRAGGLLASGSDQRCAKKCQGGAQYLWMTCAGRRAASRCVDPRLVWPEGRGAPLSLSCEEQRQHVNQRLHVRTVIRASLLLRPGGSLPRLAGAAVCDSP